jgi:hypothetical protein
MVEGDTLRTLLAALRRLIKARQSTRPRCDAASRMKPPPAGYIFA